MLRKWNDLLGEELTSFLEFMPEEDVDDQYEELVDKFCRKYDYSERIKNLAFYDRWWDTFADEYYKVLEEGGTKIIHDTPMEGDWDYGKKFEFKKGYWEEVK